MGVGVGWDLPPGSEPWTSFHWFQPSTRATLVLVILNDQPVWYTGHFVAGRMCPCTGAGCEYCDAGIGAQVRYAFAVAETTSRRAGLIEFGVSNGQLIHDWVHRRMTLRGMVIEVTKSSTHRQSRTNVAYADQAAPVWIDSITAPDPALALYLTWHRAGLKMPAAFQEMMSEFTRSRTTRRS